jgi:hypothetical protein
MSTDAPKPASAKKSKKEEEPHKYVVGDVVLCKVKGFPAWYVLQSLSLECPLPPTRRSRPCVCFSGQERYVSEPWRHVYPVYWS